jgi:hypothetical protein
MNSSPEDVCERGVAPGLLEAARRGSEAALAELLIRWRPYLLRVAREEFPKDLSAKVGASDLVQESFLEAFRDFSQFKVKRSTSCAAGCGAFCGIIRRTCKGASARPRCGS